MPTDTAVDPYFIYQTKWSIMRLRNRLLTWLGWYSTHSIGSQWLKNDLHFEGLTGAGQQAWIMVQVLLSRCCV